MPLGHWKGLPSKERPHPRETSGPSPGVAMGCDPTWFKRGPIQTLGVVSLRAESVGG